MRQGIITLEGEEFSPDQIALAYALDLEGAGSIGLLGGDEPKLPAP